jgi:hypothetical protein
MDFVGPQFDPVCGLSDAETDFINIFRSYLKTLDLIIFTDLKDNYWVAFERLFGRPS